MGTRKAAPLASAPLLKNDILVTDLAEGSKRFHSPFHIASKLQGSKAQ
jgi:hypothetical protein